MLTRRSMVGLAAVIVNLVTGPVIAQDMGDDPIGRKMEQTIPSLPLPDPTATLRDQIIAADFSADIPSPDQVSPLVVKLQILLARHHVSPGVIDGRSGGNLIKAIFAYNRMGNLSGYAELDEVLWTSLSSGNASPVLKTYVIQPADGSLPGCGSFRQPSELPSVHLGAPPRGRRIDPHLNPKLPLSRDHERCDRPLSGNEARLS
jgi:hypothetical protein